MPVASVIVPARDAAGTIGRTLAGLSRQRVPGEIEVIVVDDGSADDTAEIARAAPVVDAVLENDGSGPAAARNLGARAAAAPVLAFLDADCEPSEGWLEAGLARMGEADLVQGAVRPSQSSRAGPFDRTLWVQSEHGLYESANLFVAREWFDRVAGFESVLRPRRGIELGEDAWFAWRARRAGARTAFAERALVYHAVFARGPAGFVAERARVRFFPALAARIPELRETFFYGRWFLSRRTAALDLALAGVAAGRGRGPALLAALPYSLLLLRGARQWGLRRAPLVAAVHMAADLVSLASLTVGSVRARSPVL